MSPMFEIYDYLIQELKIQGNHCGSGCLVLDSESYRLRASYPVQGSISLAPCWLNLAHEPLSERECGQGQGGWEDGLAKREFAFSSSVLIWSLLLVLHLV